MTSQIFFTGGGGPKSRNIYVCTLWMVHNLFATMFFRICWVCHTGLIQANEIGILGLVEGVLVICSRTDCSLAILFGIWHVLAKMLLQMIDRGDIIGCFHNQPNIAMLN